MKKIIVLAVFSFLLVVGCKGPQGEVGPQGATGLQGVQGVQGIAGSEVIYSKWTSYSNWIGSEAAYIRETRIPIGTDPKFFDNEKDLFLIYVRSISYEIVPLPTAFLFNASSLTIRFRIFDEGKPKICAVTAYNEPSTIGIKTSTLTKLEFKWVIIKPTGNPYGGRKANINYSNYEEVKKAYNIPD